LSGMFLQFLGNNNLGCRKILSIRSKMDNLFIFSVDSLLFWVSKSSLSGISIIG
jgi:hypothetical protein